MRFRKIAPGPRPRHASSLSLVKVAVAQASGAGMSLSKAGPSSQPNHDFPEVTPVTASSPGHHTGEIKPDTAGVRYTRGPPWIMRINLVLFMTIYGSDEFLIHPWAKYVAPSPTTSQAASFTTCPSSASSRAQARLLRGRDHFQ